MDKIHALYLEDSAPDVELIRARLEADGLPCNVEHTDCKAGFEAALARRAFDLILIDYDLPDHSGLSALELARERQPGVPLIIISAVLSD